MPRFNLAAAAIPFWLGWRRQVVAQAVSIVFYVLIWWQFARYVGRILPVSGPTEVVLVFALPYLALGLIQGFLAPVFIRSSRTSLISAIATPVLTVAALMLAWKNLPGNDYHYEEYVQEVEDDLRDLRTLQDRHFAATGTYGTFADTIPIWRSPMVRLRVGTATRTGWNATGRHHALPGHHCGIFVGTAPALTRGAREGEPRCVEFGP